MPVVRKVRAKKENTEKEPSEQPEEKAVVAEVESDSSAKPTQARPKDKRGCQFCQTKTEPVYFESASLRRFVTDRGRIIPRARCGNCAKHQRRLSKQIKYARHLSLLPFLVRA